MTTAEARRGETHADDIAYLTALARAHDRPRYYATLFAPAAIRDDIFALYGFAAEIARIPEQVSEPALGEIRLEWWRERLQAAASGETMGENPALRAIGALTQRHALPAAPLIAMIEARALDLYADPPPTLSDLEGFLGETESALFQMDAIICGASGPETADAAGHAGVAYGLARRLSSLAGGRARQSTIVPADMLAAAGLTAAGVFLPEPNARLQPAISALIDIARGHLRDAEMHAAGLSRGIRRAFLPIAVVAPLLVRIERLGPALFGRTVGLSDLEALARIGWAKFRGGPR